MNLIVYPYRRESEVLVNFGFWLRDNKPVFEYKEWLPQYSPWPGDDWDNAIFFGCMYANPLVFQDTPKMLVVGEIEGEEMNDMQKAYTPLFRYYFDKIVRYVSKEQTREAIEKFVQSNGS